MHHSVFGTPPALLSPEEYRFLVNQPVLNASPSSPPSKIKVFRMENLLFCNEIKPNGSEILLTQWYSLIRMRFLLTQKYRFNFIPLQALASNITDLQGQYHCKCNEQYHLISGSFCSKKISTSKQSLANPCTTALVQFYILISNIKNPFLLFDNTHPLNIK